MSDQFITVECRVCGAPLNLPFTPTGNRRIDDMLMTVARATVHDICAGKRFKQLDTEPDGERQMRRSADWRLLCPPQYQNSHEWIETNAAKDLNLEQVRTAIEWQFSKDGLVLHGKVSKTGKTTAAWCVCYREFNAGKFIVAMDQTELFDKALSLSTNATPESQQWSTLVHQADLLFIDELGKSQFNKTGDEIKVGNEFLFELVESRISNSRPTIFTVNMSGSELKAAMTGDKGTHFMKRMRDCFKHIGFDPKAK